MIVQIPAPSCQSTVQMPYPIIGLVCQLPHTTSFSFYSMTKMNYAAKNPLTVQLLKGKKISHLANCYISSFKPSHLVQTRVCSGYRLRRLKKKYLKRHTSGSILPTPPHPDKGQTLQPGKALSSNSPLPGHRK